MDTHFAGFEWDDGNWPKCGKHGLSQVEIESVFQLSPAIYADPATIEARWRAIGISNAGRYVFLAFTIRQIDGRAFIRPISARHMHDKEIKRYEQG